MGLSILMLILLQLPSPESVAARIIESREAPVRLVGLPCGEADAKVLAGQPTVEGNEASPLQSEAFKCGLSCSVGVRIKEGSAVDAIKVVVASLHERGRLVETVSPPIKTSALRSCNGEAFYYVQVPRPGWPLEAAFIYVSEATFRDGTTWGVDKERFATDALREWLPKQKNRK